ncbi:hypothetical protein E9549_20850 [Blastococcus sp. MG754426]|uniref:hypothetical protein n=1 Tax=unclassified Blastococcus TaxID=2619396 RepID=UPI001EF11982|nr:MULTISPECIES: hypothetical protein [unclassified Blastococcus]MCF6509818.1 hypothetical protein [Blastococcus sp. MG754426]MCF6514204.1 hypothetical protein [Blastococcus sp. MG754427]
MTAGLPSPLRHHPILDNPALASLHEQKLLHEETAAVLEARAGATDGPQAEALLRRARRRRAMAARLAAYLRDEAGRSQAAAETRHPSGRG